MSLNLSRCAGRAPFRGFRVRGGALLGAIVGIIIGLAIALGVALYVAKVPIPFVSNVPVHNSGQDAAEDQKNRNWNPNAALQTRGPVQPASAGQPRSPLTVPPPVEVGHSVPPDQSAASVPAQSPPRPTARQAPANGVSTDDALGDFATAHDRGGNTTPSIEIPPAFTYFVQTGAFRTTQDADAERARLSLLGMEAAVTERDQAGRPVYRVRVGPFQNKAAADQIRDRLADSGFEAALVRVPR